MKKFKELMKNKLFRYLFIAGLVVVFTLIDNKLAEHGILDIPLSSTEQKVSVLPNDSSQETTTQTSASTQESTSNLTGITLADIPAYSGKAYVVINNNVPFFTDADMTTNSYEFYSELDDLGRCGVCIASIGVDIMPTEDRGEIGNVKPSGWVQEKYGDLVDGSYLYNRCHLIGHQLTGENANVKNLITGTRSFNVDAMLPFENMVADYVQETKNHVMYRVTPMFDGDNLVATGVLMEAKSVEDDGEEILFCVFCYNVQPGIVIDYATGESKIDN